MRTHRREREGPVVVCDFAKVQSRDIPAMNAMSQLPSDGEKRLGSTGPSVVNGLP